MKTKSVAAVVALVALALTAWAGTPGGPGTPPGSTYSYTLEDIYNRLVSGAAGAPRTFTEPVAGPGASTGHTLDEIMAVAPAADDTDGATAADVRSGKTFWELTSGAWGPQTGTASLPADPAPVPKTGQTASHGPRDDGALRTGVAWPVPRFTDNGDGTVTDNLTGLVWLKNAGCFGPQTWANALLAANGLAAPACGLSDGSTAGQWRLPNIRELQNLVDYGHDVALPSGHPFTDVQVGYYWSSTTVADHLDRAWFVNMLPGYEPVAGSYGGGYVFHTSKTDAHNVWPVRDGP